MIIAAVCAPILLYQPIVSYFTVISKSEETRIVLEVFEA